MKKPRKRSTKHLPSRTARMKSARDFPLGQPDFATDLAVSCASWILADTSQAADAHHEKLAWKNRLHRLMRPKQEPSA